jgi:outer membrane receptor for ferrienterochelin and colicins
MKITCLFILLFAVPVYSQFTIHGEIRDEVSGVPNALVQVVGKKNTAITDEKGQYLITNVPEGKCEVSASYPGYITQRQSVVVGKAPKVVLNFILQQDNTSLDEVVITGTLKPVSRLESAVPIEVYKPAYFKKNPTANIFEALQNVNGVRPQLNCNVCNTGDIHINGLEGPYTLVLIDGMPIVSGLSTVYGLSGIPNSLLERIEVVKGPASSLYGSEAVGGLINIITKNPMNAPIFSVDVFSTTWGETNVDLGFKGKVGKSSSVLTGVNYFNYSNPIDNNHDNFTDVTLQQRVSVFQKWNIGRVSTKLFSLAGRFFYEDRWGGEMQWNKHYRGGDEVYGESIYTRRSEVLGAYELPFSEKMLLSFSLTNHNQNSVYGNLPFMAEQTIGFTQLTWDKKTNQHDFLFGTALRYQQYNDNTPVTHSAEKTWIPSVFAQDEIAFSEQHKLLLGARYDYNNHHGSIFTPRLAYKWKVSDDDILRFNAGTGFRVVNLFTEDHAALTGSREVILLEDLEPEKSYNANMNYLKKLYTSNGTFIGIETTAWYTYFSNSILPDYDTNPNQIIYKNLDGHAVTQGVSINLDVTMLNGLKCIVGATFMEVSKTENNITTRPMLTERFSGTWAISYSLPNGWLDIDYTGNIIGPMRLPVLGAQDPRREYSPTWSVQNIQFTFKKIKDVELYAGIKNLLNWTPNRGNPFIIARADDPFDQNVQFDPQGNAMVTPDNPYGLTFDPSYVYSPNQGMRAFLGIRYQIR